MCNITNYDNIIILDAHTYIYKKLKYRGAVNK